MQTFTLEDSGLDWDLISAGVAGVCTSATLRPARADALVKKSADARFAFDRLDRRDDRVAGGRQWTSRAHSTRPALGRLLAGRSLTTLRFSSARSRARTLLGGFDFGNTGGRRRGARSSR